TPWSLGDRPQPSAAPSRRSESQSSLSGLKSAGESKGLSYLKLNLRDKGASLIYPNFKHGQRLHLAVVSRLAAFGEPKLGHNAIYQFYLIKNASRPLRTFLSQLPFARRKSPPEHRM